MNNEIKTVLFASLIVAMILPFSMVNYATAQDANTTVIDKAEEPTEFVGTLSAETRQIGSYLLVKHTYTSDELNLKNVDHVYREEVIPIDASMTQQEIDDITNNPEITLSHEMVIIHEDETTKIDKIQSGLDTVSAQAFQQWNIVEIPDDDSSATNPVTYYDSSITPVTTTSIEDWASKKNGKVYVSHDPINLIWKDTVSTDEKLMDKVYDRFVDQSWNDSCIYSTNLYVNISGDWVKQDNHFIKPLGDTLCNQHHIRAWAVNDDLVIGAAHQEIVGFKSIFQQIDEKHITGSAKIVTWDRDVFTFTGFYHALLGFDTAEDAAATVFTDKSTCWKVSKDSYNLNNKYTRQYYLNDLLTGTTTFKSSAYNDGRATVIACS